MSEERYKRGSDGERRNKSERSVDPDRSVRNTRIKNQGTIGRSKS